METSDHRFIFFYSSPVS